MGRIKFITKKFIRGITLLLGLSILVFTMIHYSPIDPIQAYVNGDTSLSASQREAIAEYWGLNESPTKQYVNWLKNIVRGDFGKSKTYNRKVITIIKDKSLSSLALMGTSWVLSGILGFILGIWSAVKEGKFSDKVIKVFSYFQMATPTFWVGIILLLIFSVHLKWLPIAISVPIGVAKDQVKFIDYIKHLILPVVALTLFGTATVTLHTREKMIKVLNSEYVLFAKARGESTWDIIKNHGIKNAALPAIAIHFASFGELFGGSILAEKVFSYPGLGSTLTEAGLKSDLPLLMGITIFSALFVFFGNLIGDILNASLNPRLKEGL